VNYLALDLGTKCGVAFNIGARIEFTRWRFIQLRGKNDYGSRFSRFSEHLESLHKSIKFEHILYEEVRAHKGTRAAHIYGGFVAVLAVWAEAHKISMTPVGVGTIKRRITGRGNASKQQVVNACLDRGYAPKTFDEADALALLLGVLEAEILET
jgi:crossover junction endodeoxyribonuclease RuvC